MSRRNDLLSYAPITALVLLMAFFYTIFMITLVPPLAGGTYAYPVNSFYADSDVVSIVVVNFFFVMVLVAFLKASFTQPGSVPNVHPWDPDCPPSYGSSAEMDKALADKGMQNIRGLERKLDGRARFCRMCGTFKPDRAHHSSNMGMCILELDHFCPWIRNCVGYYNKKYFFLLIFYGSICFIGMCVALGPRFIYACQHMRSVLDFFIVFAWILSLFIGIVVTAFTFFHVYLMANAYTTIEFCEKKRSGDTKRNAQGIKVKDLYAFSPYDLGVYRNICHVLGPNPLLWFIPTRYGMNDGVAAGCVYEFNQTHPLYVNAFGGTNKIPTNDTSDTSATLLSEEPQSSVRTSTN